MIDSVLAELVKRHRRAWATAYADSPELLKHSVTELLTRMRLIEPAEDGGWRLLAAAARYTAEVTT
jgi:hypothetical protein